MSTALYDTSVACDCIASERVSDDIMALVKLSASRQESGNKKIPHLKEIMKPYISCSCGNIVSHSLPLQQRSDCTPAVKGNM